MATKRKAPASATTATSNSTPSNGTPNGKFVVRESKDFYWFRSANASPATAQPTAAEPSETGSNQHGAARSTKP